MKTQKKRLITVVAATLLLGSAGLAMAYGGGHGFDRERCDHGSPTRMLERLDGVTDEQRDQLRKVFDEQRDTMRDRRDAMRDSRKAIRDAISNGAGKEEVQKLANKQGELVAAMIMAKAEMREKMATVLTEEQMKELQDYRSDRMEKRKHW